MQFDRSMRMLRSGVGPKIVGWLADPEIIEIMLDPDGRLWIDRLGKGVTDSGESLSPEVAERHYLPGFPSCE